MKIRDRIKEFRRVRAGELKPSPRNWREHPESQRVALQGILAEVGYADALLARELADGSLELVDGHLRAELDPDQEVPVLVLDLDEAEAAKLLTVLDPLAAMAEADEEALTKLLAEIETDSEGLREMLEGLADDYGLDVFAGNGEVEEVEPQIDRAAELQEKWGTELGQLWVIPSKTVEGGEHRVLCGDSTKAEDVERVMGGRVAILGVTSPPYNQKIDTFKPSGMHKEGGWVGKVGRLAYKDSMPESDYQAAQTAALHTWHDIAMADRASMFYNHKNRYRNKHVVSPLSWLPGPFRLRQEIIWLRPGSVTQNARMFLPCDERIYWMYKGDDFQFDDITEHKTWSSVWKIGLETNRDHAVGFPVELPARCIRACSSPGELVFEPYTGSGTTMVAAEQLGRLCYGLEISDKYTAVILERMTDLGLTPSLEP